MVGLGLLFYVVYVVSLLYDRFYIHCTVIYPKYMTIIIKIRMTLYSTIVAQCFL